jgi:hypothetical protein
MRYLSGVVLLVLMGFADEPQQPVCSKENQARFWPEEANSNHELQRQLYQRGELQICALVGRKYKWQYVSVNIHNLTKEKRHQ